MTRVIILAVAGALGLAGCGEMGSGNPDKSKDRGVFDPSGELDTMRAGIWYSPQGCQYWIIDDGVEGYLSPRYNPSTGKPVCNDVPADFPGLATGTFKQGSTRIIGDPI